MDTLTFYVSRFTLQSISKVFTLTMALQLEGDGLWKRVGREPSGNPFNSLAGTQALELFTTKTGISIF